MNSDTENDLDFSESEHGQDSPRRWDDEGDPVEVRGAALRLVAAQSAIAWAFLGRGEQERH